MALFKVLLIWSWKKIQYVFSEYQWSLRVFSNLSKAFSQLPCFAAILHWLSWTLYLLSGLKFSRYFYIIYDSNFSIIIAIQFNIVIQNVFSYWYILLLQQILNMVINHIKMYGNIFIKKSLLFKLFESSV